MSHLNINAHRCWQRASSQLQTVPLLLHAVFDFFVNLCLCSLSRCFSNCSSSGHRSAEGSWSSAETSSRFQLAQPECCPHLSGSLWVTLSKPLWFFWSSSSWMKLCLESNLLGCTKPSTCLLNLTFSHQENLNYIISTFSQSAAPPAVRMTYFVGFMSPHKPS